SFMSALTVILLPPGVLRCRDGASNRVPAVQPGPLQAMLALEKHLSGCGLDHRFIHLLKLRASQINGCAYCIDMHSLDARAAGETEQRLYALDAWRETP